MSDQASGKRRSWRKVLGWPVGIAIGAFALYSSCGGDEINFFQPVAEPLAEDDPDARMEAARVLMDKKEYGDAANLLEPMIDDGSQDSNEVRLLYAAAQLGVAQLDIWSIISSILDAQDDQAAGGAEKKDGLDAVFDALSDSVLGTGAARQARLVALADAIVTLRAAPEPDDPKVLNTACLLAGILAVPTLADAKASLAQVNAALAAIRDAAASGGADCPNISLLDEATAGVTTASTNFSLVLQAAASCPFLDVEETAALMNSVEEQMALLKANTDKGCDALPTCPPELPSCQSLFPTCVQEALKVGTSSAKAGDGLIAACELMLHCTSATACFK